MKNFFRIMLAVTLSLTYFFIPANFAMASTEEQLTYDPTSNNALGTGSEILVFEGIGQRLTIANKTITHLGFYLKKIGTPDGTITFEIREIDNTILASKLLGNSVDISGNITYYEVEFDTPVYVNGEVRILATSNSTGSYSNAPLLFFSLTDVKSSEGLNRLQDTTWDSNLYANKDCAYKYIYVAGDVTGDSSVYVTTQFVYNTTDPVTGNMTIAFPTIAWTSPLMDLDDIGGHLGLNADNWTEDSKLNSFVFQAGVSCVNYVESGFLPLSANTTYYYQGYAIVNEVTYKGKIRSFLTDSTGKISIITENLPPVLQVTKIENVSSNYDESIQPVLKLTAKITSDITLVAIKRYGFMFSLSNDGYVLLPLIQTIIDGDALTPDKTFTVALFLGDDNIEIGWITGYNVYFLAFADNENGRGFSEIEQLTSDDYTIISVPDTTAIPITEVLKNTKSSLGLEGILGSWAFMFILLILVALVFGIAIMTVNGITRQAVAVAWILSSIALVGGFLFTGELGVWTIIIASGSVIAIVIIFVSMKLTGGGTTI